MKDIDLMFAKAEKDALLEPQVKDKPEVPLIDHLEQSAWPEIEEGDCIITPEETYRLMRHRVFEYGFSILLPENIKLVAEKNFTAIYSLEDRILITVKKLDMVYKTELKTINQYYIGKMVEAGQQAKVIG